MSKRERIFEIVPDDTVVGEDEKTVKERERVRTLSLLVIASGEVSAK